MRVEPYLDFGGKAEEAIEFYKNAVGAKVERLMRFKDFPGPDARKDPQTSEKVMHASLRIGDSRVMASDGRCTGTPNIHGFCLSLALANDADAKKYFDALSDGAKITMPLGKTFFASSFGMLTDHFGVNWMVVVQE